MRVFCAAGFTGCACFLLLDSHDARVLCCWVHGMRMFCAARFTGCACLVLLDSQDARVLCCSVCHLTGVGVILIGENRSTHR
jgi:hypothetical protein